ncbi:MAG: chemotaxis-specific protein-glutamate methyltransferase CheB [Telmatospirillum sp.]|nr:chemotaxis-specific protein-glutamate methyltransferase CheB [Telmatospirillum sp.]
MAAPIRVLIVDDSSLARAMLRSIFEDDGGFQVVAEAGNGRDAVIQAQRLRPDLITMDLEMPVMGGLDAIEEIMGVKAVPILVVSSVADAQKAYTAVARGAIEVVSKPGVSASDIADFVDKARLVASIPVITHVRIRRVSPDTADAPRSPQSLTPQSLTPQSLAPQSSAPVTAAGASGAERVVAIAASTGGPQALAHILGRLSPGFASPIVIAQHIADGFAPGLVDWLASITRLPVRLGRAGESLTPGVVYLSPSEHNMTVSKFRRIDLSPRQPGQVYRPSCDALLTSVAQACGRQAMGLILTGMGSDGVSGMEAIRAAGGMTLAQDEASSVIFGMNAIAIEKGWVQRVLPLDALADLLAGLPRLPVGGVP